MIETIVKNKKYYADLNDERQKIEDVIRKRSVLDHALDAENLSKDERDRIQVQLHDLLTGTDLAKLFDRYVAIQDEQWDYALGRPSRAGTEHRSEPN